MELAALGSSSVLRDADVMTSRERSRQARFRGLLIVLVVVGAPVIGRTAAGVVRYVQGNYAAAAGDFHWPHPGIPSSFLPYVPGLLLVVLLGFVLGGPLLMAGRSPHVLYRPEEIGIDLSDVVGADVVVEEVVKTLNLFLGHRTFEEQMGGTSRRAVLFEGPPGTGKTYIAKAMAAEAGVPFLFVSSSAFQSMYYGQTNRKIRSYFRALQRYGRREGGAIGFIEEIDAIGGARHGMGSRGDGVSGVVNELLVQLQSFDEPTTGQRVNGAFVDFANRFLPAGRQLHKPQIVRANVLVVAATNRRDDLDPALVRPGRFDRTIYFGLPGRQGRAEIIAYYLGKKAHGLDLDGVAAADEIAGMTIGYSPADLERLLDEALIVALTRGRSAMQRSDVAEAKLATELGMTDPANYTADEKRRVATHEAGHATVAYFVGAGRKLDVLSIVKRRDSLGLLQHSDAEERFMQKRSEMEALLRISMGGLVAEELWFANDISSGPAGDLLGATRLACAMVGGFGMGESFLSIAAASGGPLGGTIVDKVLADDRTRADADKLLQAAYEDAKAIIVRERGVVEALRDALVAHDELIGGEIIAVVESVPGVRGRGKVTAATQLGLIAKAN